MNRSALAAWGTSPAHVDGWRSQASCLDHDPELFWPVGTTGQSVPWIAEAIAVCAGCPVRVQCLKYALDNGIVEGVWGGLSEDERTTLKRRQDRVRLARRKVGA
jgi:WhiB family transcriptional regulator, redox-sensing transcriptional regulator